MGIGLRLGPLSVRSSGRGSDLAADGLGYAFLFVLAGGLFLLVVSTAVAGLVGVLLGLVYFLSYPGGGSAVWGSAFLRWVSVLGILEGLALVGFGIWAAVGIFLVEPSPESWTPAEFALWEWGLAAVFVVVVPAFGLLLLLSIPRMRRRARNIHSDAAACRSVLFWFFSLLVASGGPLISLWVWSSASHPDFSWFFKLLVIASGVGVFLPPLFLTIDRQSVKAETRSRGRKALWLLMPVATNGLAVYLVGVPSALSDFF